MHPLLTPTHHEYRSQIRAFAESKIAPLAHRLDEDEEFSAELTKLMGTEGLLGINIPKEYGGQQLDSLSYIIAVEELARIDGSQAATVAAHNSLGLAPILNYGSAEQKSNLLPKLTNGRHLWAFGLTEVNAGSDARGVETVAVKNADKWVVNGSKRYITNISNELTLGITLLAKTTDENGEQKLSAFIVESSNQGFKAQRMKGKMMWRASDTGNAVFKDCIIPHSNIIGEQGKGLNYMLETLDGGRLSIAAMGLGLAQGAFEMALKYSQKRKQFNKAISKNQSISFKLADMDLKLELARNTLYNACWLKDNSMPFSRQAAMAKLYTSEIAKEIADEALQIFAGAGLFKNNPIERFYRDQRILQIGEGTSEILRLVIARGLMQD